VVGEGLHSFQAKSELPVGASLGTLVRLVEVDENLGVSKRSSSCSDAIRETRHR